MKTILSGLLAGASVDGVEHLENGKVPEPVPSSLQQALSGGPRDLALLLSAGGREDSLPWTTSAWASWKQPWHLDAVPSAPPPEVKAWMARLFETIAKSGLGFKLTPYDLFSARMFSFGPSETFPKADLALLFLAEECPRGDAKSPCYDGSSGSDFQLQAPRQDNRNILWLASTNELYIIKMGSSWPANKALGSADSSLNVDKRAFNFPSAISWGSFHLLPEELNGGKQVLFNVIGAGDYQDAEVLGQRCRESSPFFKKGTPALLKQSDPASKRMFEIIESLWDCRLPTGVTAEDADLAFNDIPIPKLLEEALSRSPRALTEVFSLGGSVSGLGPEVENWASGGNIERIPEPHLGAYLTFLFNHVRAHYNHQWTKYDLFHGHMYAFPPVPGDLSSKGELAILFHAKEYPAQALDVGETKSAGSPFDAEGPAFENRNVLWLASTGRTYYIHPNDPSGENEVLILGLDTDFIYQEIYGISVKKFNTVDDTSLFHGSFKLGDIDLMPEDLDHPSKSPFKLFAKLMKIADEADGTWAEIR